MRLTKLTLAAGLLAAGGLGAASNNQIVHDAEYYSQEGI